MRAHALRTALCAIRLCRAAPRLRAPSPHAAIPCRFHGTSDGNKHPPHQHPHEHDEHHHDHKHEDDANDQQLEREMVEMWNDDAAAGPEYNTPLEYEPTKYGDWARKGRVSDF